MFSPSVENLVAQLTRLPSVGQRTAQRLAFHLLSVPKEEALALAARARGGEGAGPLLQRVREPDRGGDLRDLPRRAARPHDRLRRRAAGRPDLGRAHARVPRPLPRARRLALAARRRRARAPAHRRAARPRRAQRRPGGRARDEPEHDRRGDGRVSSPTACAAACASRGWPAACPSAPTSSTPTRSRSAGRCRAAAKCEPRTSRRDDHRIRGASGPRRAPSRAPARS